MRRFLCLAIVASTSCVLASDATFPGQVTTPFPTIVNLAVEWQIEGDDDLDANCNVRFRVQGTQPWTTAMPLRRVPAGASKKTDPIVPWTNRMSGSIFDLQPDTSYEIELNLSDPDGGNAQKQFVARTRPIPTAAANARVTSSGPSGLRKPNFPAIPAISMRLLIFGPGRRASLSMSPNRFRM